MQGDITWDILDFYCFLNINMQHPILDSFLLILLLQFFFFFKIIYTIILHFNVHIILILILISFSTISAILI